MAGKEQGRWVQRQGGRKFLVQDGGREGFFKRSTKLPKKGGAKVVIKSTKRTNEGNS